VERAESFANYRATDAHPLSHFTLAGEAVTRSVHGVLDGPRDPLHDHVNFVSDRDCSHRIEHGFSHITPSVRWPFGKATLPGYYLAAEGYVKRSAAEAISETASALERSRP
jgi:hypothetical protein